MSLSWNDHFAIRGAYNEIGGTRKRRGARGITRAVPDN